MKSIYQMEQNKNKFTTTIGIYLFNLILSEIGLSFADTNPADTPIQNITEISNIKNPLFFII